MIKCHTCHAFQMYLTSAGLFLQRGKMRDHHPPWTTWPPRPLPSYHRTTLLPSSDSREHCRCRRARHVSFSRVQSPLPPSFSSFLSHFFVWPLLSSPQTRPVTPLLEVNVTNVGNERERAPTSLSPAPYLDGSGMGRCDAEWRRGSPRNLGDESGGQRRRSVCTFAGPRGREKAAGGRTDGDGERCSFP